MFSYKRADRVKELMLREISTIIRDEVKDPRIGFVTITGVDLSNKLQYAKVFISPMGSDEQKENSFKGICSAAKFIRSQLGKRMRIKFLPELFFKIDHSPDHSDKINRLLHKLDHPASADPAEDPNQQS